MESDENKNAGKAPATDDEASGDEHAGGRFYSHSRQGSTTDDKDEEESGNIELGPQCSLRDQLEKDKDDESLRKWKEQLLGSVDMSAVGETLEPEVKMLSFTIKTNGRDDIVLPVPESGKPEDPWFTLKEGSQYRLVFTFRVSHNIVSGLKYINTVWRRGLRGLRVKERRKNDIILTQNEGVDSTKEMIGTFSPQEEAYTHEMPEETTPSGNFVKGTYTAKSKVLDDDKKCHLEINYTFSIRKDWH